MARDERLKMLNKAFDHTSPPPTTSTGTRRIVTLVARVVLEKPHASMGAASEFPAIGVPGCRAGARMRDR